MRQAEARPDMDALALRLLRIMLFELNGARAGTCTHALEAIAQRAKLSRATVVRRLRLLVDAGFIERVRRAVLVDVRAGWRGAARWCQTTTAYFFKRAPEAAQGEAEAVNSEAQREPPLPRIQESKTRSTPPRWAMRAAREAEALEKALEALGKAVASRERPA